MDPRKILGVDIDASLEEIQKAYRKQARKHHPDLGGDAWAFQQVQDAFEQLTKSQTSSSSRASSSARAPRPSSAAPNDRSSRRQAGQADSKRPPESSGRRPESSHRDSSGPAAKKANGSKNRNDPRSQGSRKSRKKLEAPLQWKKLFGNELPLQTETSVFILLNCLDVFMTYILLTKPGAFESNPVANYFLHNFGFNGMVIFKLVIVAVVCVIAQIAALKKIRLGQFLLIAGSLLVGYVVVYSVRLYIANFM